MTVLETTFEALASVQTEVTIFLVALVLHWLVFSNYRVGGKKSSGGKGAKRAVEKGKPSKTPVTTQAPAQSPGILALAREVKPLLREITEKETMFRVLEENLQQKSSEDTVAALAGLLEVTSKTPGTEGGRKVLLAAVRDLAKARVLHINGHLGELLLKGFLVAKQSDQFDEVLAEVGDASSWSPGIAILAMRAALSFSDLDLALRRLPGFAAVLHQPSPAGPSNGPQQLMQQLVQLATGMAHAEEQLLQGLGDCGLFVPWVVEILLGNRGSDVLFEKTVALVHQRGVELTPTSRAALIRRAPAREAARLLTEAASTSPGMLLAAAEVAQKYKDAGLAGDVLKMLPEKPSLEVAAAALMLYGEGSPMALVGRSADEAVLQLYEDRLAGAVDILADTATGQLVADAALRQGRTTTLKKLLAASEGPRHVALLKSVGNRRCLEDAFAVYKACEAKTSCMYNALLDVCIECGDVQAAELIMKEATASGLADVITYNTMIKAHLHSGSTRKARAAIESMRAAGLSPNVVTFNEMIDETMKNNRDGGWDLIEEMKACGLRPNQVTCSILLKSIQKYSRTVDVERTLAIMDSLETEIDEVLLSSLCEACIRAGRSELLAKQLQRHRGAGGVKVQGAHTFGSIIRAYGFIKDISGIWDTWNEMRYRRIVPTSITLGCMAEAVCMNEGPDAGYKLIQDVLGDPEMKPLVNAVIYSSVLKGFCHQKRYDQVWKVHAEMVKEKVQFSVTTYNTLIDACARSCNMARVPDFLQEMNDLGIEPNLITYSTIVKGYCQENRLEKAFELLEDMKKTKQFLPDEITYNTLLDGCARHGYFDRGMALLEDMQAAKVSPSNFTLSVLVKLCNRSNKAETAFELCKDLGKKFNLKLNIHVYNNLMHACTQHNDLRRALSTFEQLLQERIRPDVRSYSILLRGCCAAGETREAACLLRAAAGKDHGHPRLASFDRFALRPTEYLPTDLVSEVLEDIASKRDENLAMQVLQDLRSAQGIRLDPKLQSRLTAKAVRSDSRW